MSDIFRSEQEYLSSILPQPYDILSQDCWQNEFSLSGSNFGPLSQSRLTEEISQIKQQTHQSFLQSDSTNQFAVEETVSDYLEKNQQITKPEENIFIKEKTKKISEFDEVFSQNPTYVKKNNNVIKLMNKKMIYLFHPKGKEYFQEDRLILNEMENFIKKEKKRYGENSNWNNNLESMKKIYSENQDSSYPSERSYLTRKMAHSMIRSHVIPSIHQNKQITKLKKSYLYTLKIQMLRCFNKDLMTRTETH